ncbi:MAG: hypothetical protein HYU57_09995 [Micavibrio aeruginosavorus]|nr:hypothetical protein [Micavibrio aeruginosavorus]
MIKSGKWKWFLIPYVVMFITATGGLYYFFSHIERFLYPTLIPPEHAKFDILKPLDQQTRIIDLGGRTLKVPIMYLDTALDPGREQDAMLLEVAWPDMRSTKTLSRAEYDQIWAGKKIGWILLEPSAIRPPLDVQVGNQHFKKEYIGLKDGVEEYKTYGTVAGKTELYSIRYLQRDLSGHITDWIECARGAYVVRPTCEHKFSDRKLIYAIIYNEGNYFSQWQEMKRISIDFINAMDLEKTKTE